MNRMLTMKYVMSGSPQVNYFCLFLMLLAIKHVDSSAKCVCLLQLLAHWSPRSETYETYQQSKNPL
jgi:hypothetical protein